MRHVALYTETVEAIRAMQFWPGDWKLSVTFVGKDRSVTAKKNARGKTVHLRLRHTWLTDVHARGLADVITSTGWGRRMVLAAPVREPSDYLEAADADELLWVHTAWHSAGSVQTAHGWLARWGGELGFGSTPGLALRQVQQRFHAAIVGEPECPF